MSVKTAINARTSNNAVIGNNIDVIWQRPADWLTLETLNSSSQKVIILMAVRNDDANYIAFTASGNYTVDWGDGISENVNTGVKAQHRYNWADINANTLNSDGYRQVIINVTPQSGQTLQTINFQQYHTDGPTSGQSNLMLELKVAVTSSLTLSNYTTNICYFPLLKIVTIDNYGSAINSTWFRGNAEQVRQVYLNKATQIASSGPFQYIRTLEYVYINPACTSLDLSNLFLNCYSLKKAPYFNTSAATNFTSMFSGCSSLEYVPTYNTSSATAMSAMFYNCSALKQATIGATSGAGAATNQLFSGCSSLEYVVFLAGFKPTTFNNTFANCFKLKGISSVDVSLSNSFNTTFQNCYELEQVPYMDLSSSTTYSYMFNNCYALKSIPNFTMRTAGTTSTSNMFNGCSSLEYVPEIFSGMQINDNSSMFASCGLLQKIPVLGLSSTTPINTGFFTNTSNLIEIGDTNISNCTSVSALSGASGLRKVLWTGLKFSYNYGSKMIDRDNMNIIFDKLGTPGTTQTLTITNAVAALRYPALSRSSTTTTGSTTISITNTSSFVIGMQVTGTGISDARSVTFQGTPDTVTLAGHGIANGKLVSFATIVTTTGISVYTTYYVINATTDTFQLSLTQGGSAIALTNDGTGTMLYQTLVTNIVANTSVTIDVPASASGTNTLVYRNLNTQIAVMKRWSVTG